jgi:hypothetical protein
MVRFQTEANAQTETGFHTHPYMQRVPELFLQKYSSRFLKPPVHLQMLLSFKIFVVMNALPPPPLILLLQLYNSL